MSNHLKILWQKSTDEHYRLLILISITIRTFYDEHCIQFLSQTCTQIKSKKCQLIISNLKNVKMFWKLYHNNRLLNEQTRQNLPEIATEDNDCSKSRYLVEMLLTEKKNTHIIIKSNTFFATLRILIHKGNIFLRSS